MISAYWGSSDTTERTSLNKALARLLSTLTRTGAQPSAWLSRLPVHIDGTVIVMFAGDGDDFEKLETFYYEQGPAFWGREDNIRVVLEVLKSHLMLDRPLEITTTDENEISQAIYDVLERKLTGKAARISLEEALK